MADKLRGRAELPSVSMGRERGAARPDASRDDQSQVAEARPADSHMFSTASSAA